MADTTQKESREWVVWIPANDATRWPPEPKWDKEKWDEFEHHELIPLAVDDIISYGLRRKNQLDECSQAAARKFRVTIEEL